MNECVTKLLTMNHSLYKEFSKLLHNILHSKTQEQTQREETERQRAADYNRRLEEMVRYNHRNRFPSLKASMINNSHKVLMI